MLYFHPVDWPTSETFTVMLTVGKSDMQNVSGGLTAQMMTLLVELVNTNYL